MIGDFRDRMTIPDKFVQKFRGQITRTVKLESRNGNTFDVHVTEDLHKVVLQSGWEVFVSAHGISMGDFLVFNYDGNSWFKVLIFDPSGCERLSSSCLPMKTAPHDGQECGEKLTGTLSMRHDLPMMGSPQSERGTMIQWDNSNHVENSIVLGSSSAPSSDSSGDGLSLEDNQELSFVPSPILRNRANLTDIQERKMNEKVDAIHSKIPIYGTVMTKCNIFGSPCILDLSSKYADEYLPREDQTLMLQRRDKSWKVQFHINKNNTKRLFQGWGEFADDNNLKVGDLCLFEPLQKKNRVMNVHIIRKA
ncbi:hypothetical protein CFC21_060702 [Triticum aestivum]|uniref:TF-B3 domain-containing protein n=3 Tax=Triticinae TaxID=1648030 RepID=A0A9R1KFW8_WHEAT|nr:putative B3 domain-containing protein Os03g0621600 isoform X1 [Triticum aestivum]XP_044377632.1 putative B3 domain-containing protein Os03g0621600 isoform X1 [Triticum aestivum]KAF7052629.1 hypothetical protein CFC21_060702 [Triticum aestivum]